MRRLQSTIAVYALLITACLTVVEGVSRPLSFVLFGVVFGSILVWVWRTGELTVAANPAVLAGTLLVWFALTIGFLGSPEGAGLLRLGAFIGVSSGLLFVLSNTFAPANVYRAVAWVGATVTLVSLPTVVIGELGPLGVWQTTTLLGMPYFIPVSVFDNPNTLGSIAAMGAVGASGELLSVRATIPKANDLQTAVADAAIVEALAALCTLGVVLSTGRGALIALVVGVSMLLFIYRFGRDITSVMTVFGGLAFISVVAIAARLLPGPEILQNISLNGRGVLWHAVIQAVSERPLFGFGPGATADTLVPFVPENSQYIGRGTHSSYFRMFFIGGVVGGIGYLILCGSTLRTALADATPQRATTTAMVVAIFVMLLFEGATVFGVHPVSVMGALTVGFAQLSARTTRSIRVFPFPQKIERSIRKSFFITTVEHSDFAYIANHLCSLSFSEEIEISIQKSLFVACIEHSYFITISKRLCRRLFISAIEKENKKKAIAE